MNDRTESGSSFVQDLRDAAARNPISAAHRDGRSVDVDGREVAGRSGECFSKGRGGVGQCSVRIERKRRIGDGRRGFDIG